MEYDRKAFVLGQTALERYPLFFEERLHLYETRKKAPLIPMIGGPGRSGKDEAALAISEHTGWIFKESMSRVCAPIIALDREEELEEAYSTRHLHRVWWRSWFDGLRDKNKTILVKSSLAVNDIVVGIRSNEELQACVQEGLINVTIWVERPGIEVDPTLEYSKESCDMVWVNDRSLGEWKHKAVDLFRRLIV